MSEVIEDSFMKVVRFSHPRPDQKDEYIYPFDDGDIFLSLGEIKNMEGHIAVIDKTGIVHWGYHSDNFIIEES